MNRDFIELIDVAKSGDSRAYEKLYNMTKDSAYFVAISITKNEQDAMDILQESYIKAFESLSTLRQPEVFDSWLNRIVANNSKRYISKTKPLLFGDISNDIPDLYEEAKSSDNVPHEIIDNKETSRIVMDIIDNLSADKRLIVIMYYYQEMLIKEISETLDLPVTTVKYKLLSARQDIKKDILNLEKKGTKLYSIAPLAIISSALATCASSMEVPGFASILPPVFGGIGGVAGAVVIESSGVIGASVATVTESTVVAGAVGSVASKAAVGGMAGFLGTAGGKAIATTLAVAVIGGGTTVAVVNNNEKNNKTTEIVTTIQLDLEQDISSDNILDETNISEEETSEIKEEILASEIINMTTEGYTSIENFKIWSEFEVSEIEEMVDGVNEKNIFITGSCPLSKDGRADSITITSDINDIPYVEINGVKKEFGGYRIFDAEIIDIDMEDEYYEVIVYDHGPSADPSIHVFRYIDNSIVELGNYRAVSEYDEILFDGKGRIIDGKNYLYFLDTKIVTEFVEIKDGVVNTYHPDYTELMNKKYTLVKDIQVEYVQEDDLSDPSVMPNRVEFETGMEIKLLEVNFIEESHYISDYLVELPDGSVKKIYVPMGD